MASEARLLREVAATKAGKLGAGRVYDDVVDAEMQAQEASEAPLQLLAYSDGQTLSMQGTMVNVPEVPMTEQKHVQSDAGLDAAPGSAGAGVRFAAEEAVAEAASQAPTHPRLLRTRTPTGFVHEEEVGVRGNSAGLSAPSCSRPETLRFADEPEVVEAASAAPAHPRTLRAITPTGFLRADVAADTAAGASPGEIGALRFAAREAGVGEAASAAPPRTRPVRQRIPTGFGYVDDGGEQAPSVASDEEPAPKAGVKRGGQGGICSGGWRTSSGPPGAGPGMDPGRRGGA